MLQEIDRIIQHAGPAGLAFIALGAAIEYVFPPFPGDTLTLFGGLYAVRGGKPVPLVFALIMAGSLGGAFVDYLAGRWISSRIDAAPADTWYLRRIPRDRIREWESRFRTRGVGWLLVNRFLPAIRGPIFLAAGISRMPAGKVLLWGGLSAFAWNGLLFAAGYAVGGNAEALEALLTEYGRIAWGVLAAVTIAVLVKWVRRRRRV